MSTTSTNRRGLLQEILTSQSKEAMSRPRAKVTSTPTPPLPVIVLNKMGFGPRPGDIDAFNALGSTNTERLTAYVDQQLDPDSIDDSDCDARLALGEFQGLGQDRSQAWNTFFRYGGGYPEKAIGNAYDITFARAIYSNRQLLEVLTDFWYNHFNVYAPREPDTTSEKEKLVSSMTIQYLDEELRPYIFGNFRDMLEANAKSCSMLYYLDQRNSTVEGPNENYAREILELHSLGAENSLGSNVRQADVPRDADGVPIAYVDDDVFAATRALTGWSVDQNGQFVFNNQDHDTSTVEVLGEQIAGNLGEGSGLKLIEIVAKHKGTGHFICGKLIQRLIGDVAPTALVESAAQIFHDNWEEPDQLKKVYRHILLSSQFQTTWGQKVKRPLEFFVSALRAMEINIDYTPTRYITIRQFIHDQFNQMGQPLYAWETPDGYPDKAYYWMNSFAMYPRWNFLNFWVDLQDQNGFYAQIWDQTPAEANSPSLIVDFWLDRILGQSVNETLRQELIRFMSQGLNPVFDLKIEQYDDGLKSRVRALAALIMMTPPFQWR